MAYAHCWSAIINGISATLIKIEVDISPGLNSFTIVGLGDKAVAESSDRISSALSKLGYRSPRSMNRRVVVSLSPASIKKQGTQLDIPIAVAFLIASKVLPSLIEESLFVGEIGLDGSLVPGEGVLPKMICGLSHDIKRAFVPSDNACEAAIITEMNVFAVDNLSTLISHLLKKKIIPLFISDSNETNISFDIDYAHIKGNTIQKRLMQICALGRHNVLMFGPPGSGKTLLARALPSILPPLTFQQSVDVTSLHSISGCLTKPFITTSPFRSPHHTSSYASIVGGGSFPRPGEITLAHHGVLFLDEFNEFNSKVIESLREPLEQQEITISRAMATLTFPADFMMIAALNPSENNISKGRKISNAIMDRIDSSTEVPRMTFETLSNLATEQPSELVRKSVIEGRDFGFNSRPAQNCINSRIRPHLLEEICFISKDSISLLTTTSSKLDLSLRAVHRIIKLSRSIADLEQEKYIKNSHVMEALSYRSRTPP